MKSALKGISLIPKHVTQIGTETETKTRDRQ